MTSNPRNDLGVEDEDPDFDVSSHEDPDFDDSPHGSSPDPSEETSSLNAQTVDPSILAFARSRDIAADIAVAPTYLGLNLDPPVAPNDYIVLREFLHAEQVAFQERIEPQNLQMSEDVKHALEMEFQDEAEQVEPDWKTLLPPIPSYNVQDDPPYLLTHEGELAAKAQWAENSLGTALASKLDPEDSPLEVDRQHMPQMWQAITDYCMKADTSTKLICSKESLDLVADSQPGVLSGKALDTIYEATLPKLNVRFHFPPFVFRNTDISRRIRSDPKKSSTHSMSPWQAPILRNPSVVIQSPYSSESFQGAETSRQWKAALTRCKDLSPATLSPLLYAQAAFLVTEC